MLREKVRECVALPGFFYVPGIEKVVVNKQGIVLDSETGIQILVKNRAGYQVVNLGPGHDEVHIHRIVAETFLEKPSIQKDEKLFVNHLNGIKHDNRVINLEWATPKRNCQHAYETGLRNDNVPLLCKDLRTGEIKRFYSIWECARHFNLNGAHIHYYLRPQNYGKIRQKYFVFIKEGQSWPDLTQRDIGVFDSESSKEVLVLYKDKKTACLFKSIVDAANHLKLKDGTLAKRIRTAVSRGERSIGIGDCEVMYYKDFDKSEIVELIEMACKTLHKRKVTPRKPPRIEVSDLESGEVYQMQSIANLANKLGVSKNTLQKHIYLNEGVWHKKLHIRYL